MAKEGKRSRRRHAGPGLPPPDQLIQPVQAAGDEHHAPDGTRLRVGKKGGVYKPIRLMHRQVELISDVDYELMLEPRLKRRYARWPLAWQGLMEHVWQYPHWEWWLTEDLIREPELGALRAGSPDPGGWSQVCFSCRRWGVRRVAPHDARCLHCGSRAPWRDAPTTTEPRCSWLSYASAREAGKVHAPHPLTPRYRAGPEDSGPGVLPRERTPGTHPSTPGAQARSLSGCATDDASAGAEQDV